MAYDDGEGTKAPPAAAPNDRPKPAMRRDSSAILALALQDAAVSAERDRVPLNFVLHNSLQ